MTSRSEYGDLASAMDEVAAARACIAENRGHEKEEAREGYEAAVAESLVPKLLAAIELACGDMDARDVERLALVIQQRLLKADLR